MAENINKLILVDKNIYEVAICQIYYGYYKYNNGEVQAKQSTSILVTINGLDSKVTNMEQNLEIVENQLSKYIKVLSNNFEEMKLKFSEIEIEIYK